MRLAGTLLLGLAVAPEPAFSPEPGNESGEAHYIDASLDLEGDLLSWRFVDLEGDGARELVLAVRTPAGDRELRVHRLRGQRLEPEPAQRVPILSDVLAWGLADVRAEPGRELLLLTRGGAWSYSLGKPGYRDNARVLVRDELVYDLPDPRALPYWAYVLPGPKGRDLVLLPGRDGFAIYGPGDAASGADGAYERRVAYDSGEATVPADDEPRDRPRGEGGPRVAFGGSAPFVDAAGRRSANLLEASRTYRAPALVDFDGDGRLDLVLTREEELVFYRGGPDGPGAEPTRVEPLPEDWSDDDLDVQLQLVDLDGDGDRDLLAHVAKEAEGLENTVHRVVIYRQREGRLLRDEPDQVLRFEAGFLLVEVADVDGDGRVDLALRKLELPSLLGTVTGLSFTFRHLVHLGERRGFARKPALDRTETYDEDSVIALAANRTMKLDCNGDGIADLVEVDLEGDVAVRRLRKTSGFLTGTRWELDATPWKRFPTDGSIESLTVEDLNGDGLGDIVSASERRLSVLLSARGGAR